jgi:hypothetical protein
VALLPGTAWEPELTPYLTLGSRAVRLSLLSHDTQANLGSLFPGQSCGSLGEEAREKGTLSCM